MNRRSGSTSNNECTPRFHSAFGSLPRRFSAILPIRVMIRMLSTTYFESVISNPTFVSGESGGPMMYGTTNMVRPRIAPFSSPYNFEYVSAGSDQLFVGPASSLVGVQMNVTFSTRATSFGLDRCKYERGTFFSFSLISTFCFNDSAIKNSFSRSEPSHQKMFSGFVSFPISRSEEHTSELQSRRDL